MIEPVMAKRKSPRYIPNSERSSEEIERLREQRREHQRRFRATHPEYANARATAWRAANPEKEALIQRRAFLKRRYQTTPEEVDAMAVAQGGLCAICGEARELIVEHSHTTGKIRALTCDPCNVMLGMAHESPDVLRRGAEYLEKHHAL